MKIEDITFYRLQQQHVLKPVSDKPEVVVKWLGAVQALSGCFMGNRAAN